MHEIRTARRAARREEQERQQQQQQGQNQEQQEVEVVAPDQGQQEEEEARAGDGASSPSAGLQVVGLRWQGGGVRRSRVGRRKAKGRNPSLRPVRYVMPLMPRGLD